jgi:hypothetical protein
MDPVPLLASRGYQWIFLICEPVRVTSSKLVTRTTFILVPELLITIFNYVTNNR